ncbi:MAG: hypothetical protein IKE43_03535 [Coriobacteriales bacterium]|nr:hypothetical protein [Coriobacteriales bacterium]
MLRLLRSDLYRLIRGKMMWMLALIFVAHICFMTWVEWFAIQTFDVTEFGLGAESAPLVDALTGQLTQSLSLSMEYGTIAISGGFLALFASLFAALVAVSDFSTGYIQGLFSARQGRASYFAEKFLLFALYTLFLEAISMLATYVALRVAGFGFASIDWPVFLGWCAVAWALACGYAFITACITWLTKSKALGCVTAVVLATSTIGGILTGIMLLLPSSDAAELMEAIIDWLPFMSQNTLSSGETSIANGKTWTSMFTSTSDMLALTHILITTGVMWVISIVTSFIVGTRRDI